MIEGNLTFGKKYLNREFRITNNLPKPTAPTWEQGLLIGGVISAELFGQSEYFTLNSSRQQNPIRHSVCACGP